MHSQDKGHPPSWKKWNGAGREDLPAAMSVLNVNRAAGTWKGLLGNERSPCPNQDVPADWVPAGGWHKAQAGELNLSSSFSVPSSPGDGEVCSCPAGRCCSPISVPAPPRGLVNLHQEEGAGHSSGAVNRAGASCPAAARGTRPSSTGAVGRAPVGAGGVPTSPCFLHCRSHSTNPQPLSQGTVWPQDLGMPLATTGLRAQLLVGSESGNAELGVSGAFLRGVSLEDNRESRFH